MAMNQNFSTYNAPPNSTNNPNQYGQQQHQQQQPAQNYGASGGGGGGFPPVNVPASQYNASNMPPRPAIPNSQVAGSRPMPPGAMGHQQPPPAQYQQPPPATNNVPRSTAYGGGTLVGNEPASAHAVGQSYMTQNPYTGQSLEPAGGSSSSGQQNPPRQAAKSYQNPPPANNYQNPPATNNYQNPPPANNYQNPPPANNYQNPPPANNYQNPPPANNYQNASYNQQASMSNAQAQSNIHDDVTPIDPTYMSFTCNAMPRTRTLQIQSRIPIGVVMQPMADSPTGEELPTVTFSGGCPVVRCKSCRTYINPYVTFVENGKRWRCNLCNNLNDVPPQYYGQLDASGRRADRFQRPELSCASIEIIAPEEYTVRQPQPPVYLFVIDVSKTAIESGYVRLLCHSILSALDLLPGEQRSRMGFITFNGSIHFYNLKSTLSSPQMIVCPDIEDLFLPRQEDLIASLDESRDLIESLLESLPEMHADTTDVECAFGPAIKAAQSVMRSDLGGKILTFVCSLPSIGNGRLKNRDSPQLHGNEKEHTLLQKATDFYKNAAVQLTRNQSSVDVFQFSRNEYMDVATVSGLAKHSGGALYFYEHYTEARHGDQFCQELTHTLTRTTGWEAVSRLRLQQGLRASNVYGSFALRGGYELLATPNVNSDQAFTFDIELMEGDNVQQLQGSASIQVAVLYTTSEGERRIRVHTAIVPVARSAPELYESINISTLCCVLAKQAQRKSIVNNLYNAREHIQSTCLRLIRAFRSTNPQYRQLDALEHYPEHLQAFPLLVLGLLKSDSFRDGPNEPVDARSASLFFVLVSGVSEIDLYLRPRVATLFPIDPSVGLVTDEGVNLPEEGRQTLQTITSDSIALADNARRFVLRVGRQVPQSVLRELFGISSVDGAVAANLHLLPIDEENQNPDSLLYRIHMVLDTYRSYVSSFHSAYVVAEGDTTFEQKFLDALIEDRTSTVMELVEFMAFLSKNTLGSS